MITLNDDATGKARHTQCPNRTLLGTPSREDRSRRVRVVSCLVSVPTPMFAKCWDPERPAENEERVPAALEWAQVVQSRHHTPRQAKKMTSPGPLQDDLLALWLVFAEAVKLTVCFAECFHCPF